MSIGTSLGGYYEDEADHVMKTLNGNDNNVVDPNTTPDIGTKDQNIETKPQPKAEVIPVGDKQPSVRYQTWPERLARSTVDALSLPGDVYAGKVDPTSDEGVNRTLGLASLMVGAPGVPKGALGSSVSSEAIKSAALRYKGEIFEAENHGIALNKIVDKHPDIDYHGLHDGFTTTEGRFISREEAFQLASQRKQVDSTVMRAYKENQEGRFVTHEGDEPMLLSEDLIK